MKARAHKAGEVEKLEQRRVEIENKKKTKAAVPAGKPGKAAAKKQRVD
jgi:hypothetical protein